MSSVYVSGGRLDTVQRIDEIKQLKKIDELKEIGLVKDVRISALPCPKINNESVVKSWSTAQIVALAVTAFASATAMRKATKQYKIAQDYFNLAKDQWDMFYQNYRPLEDKELTELALEKPYTPDYITDKGQAVEAVDNIFNQSEQHRLSLYRKYCICPDPDMLHGFDVSLSTVTGDIANFTRAYSRGITRTRNDTRWNRRTQSANRGRNLLNSSTNFANKAQALYGDYAKAMGGIAQGALGYLAYSLERKPTVYNQPRHRVHNRLSHFMEIGDNFHATYSVDGELQRVQGGVVEEEMLALEP